MNKLLEKNLNRIKEIDQNFYEELKSPKKPSWVEVIKWNEKLNMTVQTFDDLILAYRDIDGDIEQLLGRQGINLNGTACTFIVGAGLGYMSYEILKRAKPGHKVVVVEKDAFFLREMFKYHDFTPYLTYDYSNSTPDSFTRIKESSLYIARGDIDVHSMVTVMDNVKNADGFNYLTEAYCRNRPLEYTKLITSTLNIINAIRCNTLTVMAAGSEMAKNDITSLPYIMGCPGVKELENIYKGMPAVTISTGPSLEKNIHQLKQYQDRVIIIAVAQALRILMAYDIEPDFICTVDYGETNMGHFKGLMNSKVPLVCLNRTYAEILKQYQGPKFIVSSVSENLEETESVTKIIAEKGALEQGGSVAHTCFALAMHLGCAPICLIGQDLALTDKSHTSQVDEGGKIRDDNGVLMWEVTDHRSNLVKGEQKEYSMGVVQHVPGYLGNVVRTNSGLLSFLHSFEAMFKLVGDRKILNCTEGGARIKGSKQMTLRDALEEYCSDKKDKGKVLSKVRGNEIAKQDAHRALELLNRDITKLHKIDRLCAEGIKTTIQMKKSNHHKRIASLIKRNEKISDKASTMVYENPLLKMMVFWAEKRIHSDAMYVAPDKVPLEKRKKDLYKRIDRNRLILKATRDCIKVLIPMYNESRDLIKGILVGKEFSGSGNFDDFINNVSIDDAEDYFKKENFSRPLTDARALLDWANNSGDKLLADRCEGIIKKAEEMRELKIIEAGENPTDPKDIEYSDSMFLGKEAGADRDYEKALGYLQKAYNLCPEREEAIRGLAVVYQSLKDYKKSCEYYETLNEKFPDKDDYTYECGISYILGKEIKKGMEKIGKALEMNQNRHLPKMKYVGLLYEKAGMKPEAEEALSMYFEKFPYDFEIKKKLSVLKGEKDCGEIPIVE